MSFGPSARRLTVAAMIPVAALFATPLASGGQALSLGTPRQVPMILVNPTLSTNWAGYDATTGPYTKVSASWVEPAVTCSSSAEESVAAFWVGLDGGKTGDNTVEQTGTIAVCLFGVFLGAVPWYEMYPNPLEEYNKSVNTGDRVSASVTVSGSSYTLVVSDSTQGWTRKTVQTGSGSDVTAEVIAEDPSSEGSGLLPLADFHTVDFLNAMVDGAPISKSQPVQLIMTTTTGTVKAATSILSPSGKNFTVTWKHD
jgi:hypothetical protein